MPSRRQDLSYIMSAGSVESRIRSSGFVSLTQSNEKLLLDVGFFRVPFDQRVTRNQVEGQPKSLVPRYRCLLV
jgi:hypothetical protein